VTPEKAKAKADALLKAGDALGAEFPAESRRLLRLCREWRLRQCELEQTAPKP
jgi:hypothetical protein